MFLLSETGRLSGVLPAQRPRAGSVAANVGKFAWGSNLALVFEAVQSRPSTTFPEVGMTIENIILAVLVDGFVSLILQIGDIDKITR